MSNLKILLPNETSIWKNLKFHNSFFSYTLFSSIFEFKANKFQNQPLSYTPQNRYQYVAFLSNSHDSPLLSTIFPYPRLSSDMKKIS